MYCQHCGGEVDHAIEFSSPAAEAVNVELEIARVNAERDIQVEKIRARQAREELETVEVVAEVEAEAEVLAAEAEAEVVAAVVEAGAAEPEMDAEPIVIAQDIETGEPEPEMPPRDESHHEPHSAPRKTGFF